jgi:hypothetical protein
MKNLEQEISEQINLLKKNVSEGYDIYAALLVAWTKYQDEGKNR